MNYEIQEQRLEIFQRDHWTCQHCGKHLNHYNSPQLAHRIPQSKTNIKKYGKSVIHHPDNIKSACCLGCNASLSIGSNNIQAFNLVRSIEKKLEVGV